MKTITQSESEKWVQPRVLRSQYDQITEIVATTAGYSNEVDFIRAAIREKIARFYK